MAHRAWLISPAPPPGGLTLRQILEKEISLPRLLRLAKKKFPGARDVNLQALRALVYFADADQEPDLKLLQKQSWP